MSARDHDPECLCQWCERDKHVACLADRSRGENHPDHRTPECPSWMPPAFGSTATCVTCRQPIWYEADVDRGPGYLPRTGWTDHHKSDPLICFRSAHYNHAPAAAPVAPNPTPEATHAHV